MTIGQRFCPLCDKVFSPGEAVLRCTGCDVLHHPGCWVTNGGCATANPHESAPVAQAYGMDAP
ncbi:MAG TPA: RING finger protein, partial [Tepidiformaceae bacterium]|nr:RING finger protein [Tepidiformaceae bacterium]